jgi:predicted DNA-binding protein
MSDYVSKTLRIPTWLNEQLKARAMAERKPYVQAHREALERGLAQIEGIDMAAALHDFIGMGEGTGRTHAERMKRYGRRAQHR